MRVHIVSKIVIILLLLGTGIFIYNLNENNHKITSVYLSVWNDLDNIQLQDRQIDLVFIAFAQIEKNNVYFFKDPVREQALKDKIRKLKQVNPDTKFVLSVGGYGMDGFSDASLGGNRFTFTQNMINLVKEMDLDGIDIDWEFPAFDAWATQKARAEDTENFTYLMKELRAKLNMLPHKNKKYILSFAAGTQDWYFDNVELNEVEKYVDYINVMTYDLTGKWSDTTGFNSNLYRDAEGWAKESVDDIIQKYLKRGIDSKKILMGIPAYSYGWTDVKSEDGRNGMFSPGKPIDIDKEDLSYKMIQQKYLNKNGFKRYYDEQAKAAYLFDGNIFITYEDLEAVKEKIAYIQENDLAGAMIWEYSQDSDDGIIKFVAEHLNETNNLSSD